MFCGSTAVLVWRYALGVRPEIRRTKVAAAMKTFKRILIRAPETAVTTTWGHVDVSASEFHARCPDHASRTEAGDILRNMVLEADTGLPIPDRFDVTGYGYMPQDVLRVTIKFTT